MLCSFLLYKDISKVTTLYVVVGIFLNHSITKEFTNKWML